MFKKILSVLLFMALFCNIGLIANAESSIAAANIGSYDSEVQPCYEYASKVNATLSKSSGKAKCTGNVFGYSSTTKIKITMTLQKKTLLWWSEVEEWTTTVSSSQVTLSKKSC